MFGTEESEGIRMLNRMIYGTDGRHDTEIEKSRKCMVQGKESTE